MILLDNVWKVASEAPSEVELLRGIDLRIEPHEVVGVVGPSGAGKTTLLNLIAGVDVPTRGQVTVHENRLDTMNRHALALFRREHIGMIFQSYHLLGDLSARENVEVPLLLAGKSRREARREAEPWLERVGLADRAKHLPEALSGGERQRVAIARALAAHPSILLADEPTGALDSQTGDAILDLLAELQAELAMTMVVVTHEPAVVTRCDRIIYLRDGRIDQARTSATASAEQISPPATSTT